MAQGYLEAQETLEVPDYATANINDKEKMLVSIVG